MWPADDRGPREFLAGLEGQRVMCWWSMIELWTGQTVLSTPDGGSHRTNSRCFWILAPADSEKIETSYSTRKQRGGEAHINTSCVNNT